MYFALTDRASSGSLVSLTAHSATVQYNQVRCLLESWNLVFSSIFNCVKFLCILRTSSVSTSVESILTLFTVVLALSELFPVSTARKPCGTHWWIATDMLALHCIDEYLAICTSLLSPFVHSSEYIAINPKQFIQPSSSVCEWVIIHKVIVANVLNSHLIACSQH